MSTGRLLEEVFRLERERGVLAADDKAAISAASFDICTSRLPPSGTVLGATQRAGRAGNAGYQIVPVVPLPVGELRCACPDCDYAVHSNLVGVNELWESYCCTKCQGRMMGEEWAFQGKRHYKHCERRLADPRAARAGPVLTAPAPPPPRPPPASRAPLAIRDVGRDEAWLVMRDNALYCLACNKFATSDHMESASHLRRLQWFEQAAASMVPRPPPPPPAATATRRSLLAPSPPPQQAPERPRPQQLPAAARRGNDAFEEAPWYVGNPAVASQPPARRPDARREGSRSCSASCVRAPQEALREAELGWERTLWRRTEGTCGSRQEAPQTEEGKRALQASLVSEIARGQSLVLRRDFLDYEHDPEEDGHPNAGFLVARTGETVRVLHIGAEGSDNAGWLYAEVEQEQGRVSKPVHRSGWLPFEVAWSSALACGG